MTAAAFALCAVAVLMLPGPRPRSALSTGKPVVCSVFRRRAPWIAVSLVLVTSCYVVGGFWAVCAVVVSATTVMLRRSRTSADRTRRIEIDSFASGLDVVIGELNVGSHPAIACASAAAEGSGIAAAAFGQASGRARLGGDAHAGLVDSSSILAPELSRLATVWRVSDDYGLGLAGLLSAARSDLLARRRFRDRVQSSLAGARATATVLACLPIVGVLLGQMMGAEPLGVLLGGGLGGVLLLVGSVLVCAGLLWSDAITGRVVR